MESKEKKYVICRIYKNGIDRYFVGLFNWGKTYKVAFNRCYLKRLTQKDVFYLAKQFRCNYVTEYIYEDGKLIDSKTFKIKTI